jgi:hypothetical protein
MGKYLALLLLLASCATPKKLNRLMDKLPEETAIQCDKRFPIMETIDTLTVYDTALIKAYEMEFNYLYYYIDSLLGKQIPDSTKKEIITIFQSKKVPVVKYKYITKVQESSAKVQVIRDSCQKLSSLLHKKLDKEIDNVSRLTAKCDKVKGQRNWLIWLVIALLLWTFRKLIVRLIKPL